jgi:hypothetical protein
MAKGRFSSRPISDAWVQGTNLYNVYNYYDSRACYYKRSRILSRLDGLGVEWLDMIVV